MAFLYNLTLRQKSSIHAPASDFDKLFTTPCGGGYSEQFFLLLPLDRGILAWDTLPQKYNDLDPQALEIRVAGPGGNQDL